MNRFWTAIAVATALLVVGAAQADAAFKLRITSSAGGTVTITDNGVGDTDPLTAGSISTGTITVGGFRLSLTGGLSDPILGNLPFLAEMDLQIGNVTNLSAGAGATLTIELTDDFFVLSPPAGDYVLRSSLLGPISLPTGGAVTGQAFVDNANAEFGTTGATVFTNGLLVAPGGTAPDLIFPGTSPFSATLVQTITLNQGTQVTSMDLNMRVTTPAPAGLVLALTGVPLFGAMILRRCRKAKQA